MTRIKYPAPLKRGSRIAITAFSSGVPEKLHPRLDMVISDFEQRGYEVIEGQCLRTDVKHVSGTKEQRARELMSFLLDDSIDAVVPPWGGELAMELLPLLDFESLSQARPKWIFGFSDVSTITACLSTLTGWATMHCANFMDLLEKESDRLTRQTLEIAEADQSLNFVQYASKKYQAEFIRFKVQMDAVLNLTETTEWKSLFSENYPITMEGRLIGGCLDTLGHLFGTNYLDLHAFQRRFGNEKLILYFEVVEMSPPDIIRVLLSMQFHGIFELLSGILIGRSCAPAEDETGLSYLDAITSVLGELPFPILYDVDIGHKPPNLTLINGCFARVDFDHHRNDDASNGRIEQFWAD